MLIGLCGGKIATIYGLTSKRIVVKAETHLGICAGKHSVARDLIDHHGFTALHLGPTVDSYLVNKAASGALALSHNSDESGGKDWSFATVDSLLDFVTKRWQQRWVTADIWDEGILEHLLRRPFFLLVSVDAPVSLRWKRFKDR